MAGLHEEDVDERLAVSESALSVELRSGMSSRLTFRSRSSPSFRRPAVIVLVLALVAAGGYGTYWFHAAGVLRKGLNSWIAARRAAGWRIAYGDLAIGGFPWRLSVRVTGLAVTTPRGLGWRSDTVTAAAWPWNFRHIRLSSPGRHMLDLGGWTIPLDSGRLRADLVLGPTGGFQRLAVSARSVAVHGFGAKPVTADSLSLSLAAPTAPAAVTAGPDLPPSLSFAATFAELRLPAVADATLSHADISGRVLGAVPPGPFLPAVARWSAAGGTIDIGHLAMDWAPVAIEASGTLALDTALQPIVALSARVGGYDHLIDRLRRAGTIDDGAANAAKTMLGVMAKSQSPAPDSPNRAVVPVPVTLENGALWLGPARVATVPAWHWPAHP